MMMDGRFRKSDETSHENLWLGQRTEGDTGGLVGPWAVTALRMEAVKGMCGRRRNSPRARGMTAVGKGTHEECRLLGRYAVWLS
jgi:hypothetical protein